jgi:hypothetical protein
MVSFWNYFYNCIKIGIGVYMKAKFVYILLIALVLVLGCSRPPTEEMASAREAVFRAENDANAVHYASGTLARARDALRRMEQEADSKRFGAARALATEAQEAAERAISEGRSSADRARMEAGPMVNGLKAEIDDTARNVASARYAQMDLDYNALDAAIVRFYNLADQAQAEQSAGRYQNALETARRLRTELSHINQLVAGAAPAVKK